MIGVHLHLQPLHVLQAFLQNETAGAELVHQRRVTSVPGNDDELLVFGMGRKADNREQEE